jgi:hypothetical protein
MTLVPFRGDVPEEFVLPLDRFDNKRFVEDRVAAAAKEDRVFLRLTLRYLYATEGAKNMRNDIFKAAEKYLEPRERLVTRWMKTRTNGNERKRYGPETIVCARAARFRCETCGFPDVRALQIDHREGRNLPGCTLQVLCANCHQIKSRAADWTGRAREQPEVAGDA